MCLSRFSAANIMCMHQACCDTRGFDTAIHPIPKCVIFLEDLLQDMIDKKSKDPFGTVRVARKALSKIMWFFISFVIELALAAAEPVHSQGTSKRCASPIW